MDFIVANEKREEVGSLKIPFDLDMDAGDTNDYELTVSLSDWEKSGYRIGYQFFSPGTEWGGLIQNIRITQDSDTAVLSGSIWRGMLAKKIIEPPEGQDYRIVSGEANAILRSLCTDIFGDLFAVTAADSGINVKNYKFDRYIDLLSGITKMLYTANARLKIQYVQGPPGGAGHVEIGAVPIRDLSETEEYSQDTKVRFTVSEVNNGINHLICLGKGELKDRQVVHLYADANGNISQTQTFTGVDERVDTYDYGSVETEEELISGGTDRLRELISYKQFDMTIDEAVADIGDIVGGREYTTGFLIKQQITQKILIADNKSWSIEFRVGGSIKQSSGVGGGSVDYGTQIGDLRATVLDLSQDLSNSNAKINGKVNYCGSSFATIDAFVTFVTSQPGFVTTGRFKDTGSWTPWGESWCRFWAAAQNAKGSAYNVDIQLIAAAENDIYHAYITGKGPYTATWEKIYNRIPYQTLGSIGGITAHYWGSGSTISVEVDGGLTQNISAWGNIKLGTLPSGCRPPMDLVYPVAGAGSGNAGACVFIGRSGSVQVANRSNNTLTGDNKEIFTVCTFAIAP